MANRALEARIEALNALREVDDSTAAPELASALRARTALVIHHAARIVMARCMTALLPDMEEALGRMLSPGACDDTGFLARSALAEACDELGSDAEPLFLRGLRVVEPKRGPSGGNDLAATMKVRCLGALLRLRHPEAMNEAALLLADPNPTARAGTARAIANGTPNAGVPLLRFKALIGDTDVAVLEEVLQSLMALDPDGSIVFLSDLLRSPVEAVSDIAASVLGFSRAEAACAPLLDWARVMPEEKANPRTNTVFLALAMLRNPRATKFLLDEIRDAEAPRARAAVEALSPFADDPAMGGLLREATASRPELRRRRV